MKATLICPGAQCALPVLVEQTPLVTLPFLGKTVLETWLVHLCGLGIHDVTIHAADRPDRILAIVGDGERWGLNVQVIASDAGHTPRTKPEMGPFQNGQSRSVDPPNDRKTGYPDDVIMIDHLPGEPEVKIFESYESWFRAFQRWLPHAVTPDRVGVRQIHPGVYVGLNSRIPRSATLNPPCWIGDRVFLGNEAQIGPMAVLENEAMVERKARVFDSIIGPETLVGRGTSVFHSLAWGELLIDWRTGSSLRISDAFLLSPLRKRKPSREISRVGDLWSNGNGISTKIQSASQVSIRQSDHFLDEPEKVN